MSVKKVPMGKKKGPYTPYFLSQRDCEACETTKMSANPVMFESI